MLKRSLWLNSDVHRYSTGLEYEFVSSENVYYISGLGTCTDTFLVVPPAYDDGTNGVHPVRYIDFAAIKGTSVSTVRVFTDTVMVNLCTSLVDSVCLYEAKLSACEGIVAMQIDVSSLTEHFAILNASVSTLLTASADSVADGTGHLRQNDAPRLLKAASSSTTTGYGILFARPKGELISIVDLGMATSALLVPTSAAAVLGDLALAMNIANARLHINSVSNLISSTGLSMSTISRMRISATVAVASVVDQTVTNQAVLTSEISGTATTGTTDFALTPTGIARADLAVPASVATSLNSTTTAIVTNSRYALVTDYDDMLFTELDSSDLIGLDYIYL